MNSKFSLTSETISHFGTTLYRIKAEKDFSNVTKGELGGFVEKEENISEEGDAWVSGNTRVYGDARVYGEIRLKSGWCFGWKRKDWSVTELENGDEILLIKDYEPATEEKKLEPKELTMGELTELLGYEVKIKK